MKRQWLIVSILCTFNLACQDEFIMSTLDISSVDSSSGNERHQEASNDDTNDAFPTEDDDQDGSIQDFNQDADRHADEDDPVNDDPVSGNTPVDNSPEDQDHSSENGDSGSSEQKDPVNTGCNPACEADEKCVNNTCVPICPDGTYCDGKCIDLDAMHMSDCQTCAEGYCNNNTLEDGCEIDAYGSDPHNCGGCGVTCNNGQYCREGDCVDSCESGEDYCDGSCLKLDDLKLVSCTQCEDDYCDTDDNLRNGCEVYAKGDDIKHCGSCGHACSVDQVCEDGSCVTPTRMMVITKELNVRSGPGVDNSSLGAVYEYDYIYVYEETNGWYRHKYNGQMGWSSGSYLMDACDACEGRKAIDYAEQFLYDSSTKLCTWDHLTYEPIIENFTDLKKYKSTYNYGYNDNCANFVTACLKTVGLFPKNLTAVSQITSHCKAESDGWRKVSFEKAKAGDIWVNASEGHAELVVGYKDGKVYLIGSNNFSSSAGSNLCQVNTGAKANDYQRVSYSQSSKGGTSYICSRQ